MIFLLGGPPRIGKSTISSKIRQKYALSVVSTDSLGAILENVWSDKSAPDLFVKDKFDKLSLQEREKLISTDFEEYINYVRKESHVVWKAVLSFTKRENEEGRDVVIEGVGVLPELVQQVDDIPYRVVFIGNQGDNHKESIKKSSEENEHDWMQGRSDQYISIFALFVNRMSVYIEQEAKKYGFEYLEMDKKSFDCVAEEVMKLLRVAGI